VKNSKSQLTNNKQITITKIQNDKPVWGIGYCKLGFDISEYLNIRDGVFIDYLLIVRSKPGTVNAEPLYGTGNVQ
jgi:hypothetical protein